jgi:hypothetical protein
VRLRRALPPEIQVKKRDAGWVCRNPYVTIRNFFIAVRRTTQQEDGALQPAAGSDLLPHEELAREAGRVSLSNPVPNHLGEF